MGTNDDTARLWAVVAEQGAELLRLRTELAATRAQLAAMGTEVRTKRIVLDDGSQSTVIGPGEITLEYARDSRLLVDDEDDAEMAEALGNSIAARGSRVELAVSTEWAAVACSMDIEPRLAHAPMMGRARYVAELVANGESYDPPRPDVILRDKTEGPYGRETARLRGMASVEVPA